MTIGTWFRLGVMSAALAALVPFAGALALDVPPAPTLERPVVDHSGTLTSDQITTLEQQIANSRKQKDYQFAILIIPSLQGRPIEEYSLQVARQWGIGTEQKDNGVLLLVAMQDRELRIEVGRGLEGDLTDVESGRIIRNTITPKFKSGDYFSGISLGVQNIAAQIEGRPQQDTSVNEVAALTQSEDFAAIVYFLIFLGFGLVSWLVAILARTKSWWAGGVVGGVVGLIVAIVAAWSIIAIVAAVILVMGGLLLDWAVSRNYTNKVARGNTPSWWAGGPWIGGGGWGGGSSGGGFGGGGFSGGGSSGSW